MEDLLAGLDAEMLDGFQVSPVKCQPVLPTIVKKEIRSPLRVKLENGSPSRARRVPQPKSVDPAIRDGFVASNAIVCVKTETETEIEIKVDIHPPAHPGAGPSTFPRVTGLALCGRREAHHRGRRRLRLRV
jgi:hypothetical protein